MVKIIFTMFGLSTLTSLFTVVALHALGVVNGNAYLVMGVLNGVGIYLLYTRPALVKYLDTNFPKK